MDHDMPEWRQIADRTQRARKTYACDACPLGGPPASAVIPPGQLYRKIVGLQDGELVVHRECRGVCPHAAPCSVCCGSGEPVSPDRGYCATCDGASLDARQGRPYGGG